MTKPAGDVAMLTLAQAHALLPASRIVGDSAIAFSRVHSDTRTLAPGDLYVALRGDRFDGHDYLEAARRAGAAAALAERGLGESVPGLLVDDALGALQQLAAAWRRQMTLPLIAVTGSNGKTTVTQMSASILRAWLADAALATAGNFNNHIGVPLTLLRLRRHHRAAVVELGMNHAGEIAELARIAAPTIALVNNAQREHQEFISGIEEAARENGAVIDALPASGVVVIPVDDAYTALWLEMAGARALRTFAPGDAADIGGDAEWNAEARAWSLRLRTPIGRVETTLAQAGRHNVRNAIAAAACTLAAGAPLAAIAQGIAAFRPVAGRSQTIALRIAGREATLVDDSYNANPDSVLAAIDVLASLPAPRWLVLGDMGEVGAQGPQFHAEVGAYARACGIDALWTAGTLARSAGGARHFGSVAELLDALPREMPPAASVLVKGSRFMKMEQVVRALVEAPPGSGQRRDAP
jgi:UDP-N-acetylmuramoyl-tripeptide--D-alanyl-D-alanine ligase